MTTNFPANREHIEAEMARCKARMLACHRSMIRWTIFIGVMADVALVLAVLDACDGNPFCFVFGCVASWGWIEALRCVHKCEDVRLKNQILL